MPGKIHVPVTVATQGFEKLQRTFGRLKGAAVGVTVALGGLSVAARAIDFSGAAIQGARDLERNYAGLTSVFKENTEQMKEFGRTASEMGLSMNEAAKATTFIGSVLKQSGFSIAETADLTEELVELGADLALTYGYDVQEALLGMTALFRGEYDPIEKFGVAMKQSEIDAEKAARGLDGLTGAAERFADQQIRVEFLMERAGDAIGAFERQSGNLTVQQMRLRAEFENIRDTVADDLLPPLAALTGGIREIAQDAGPGLEDLFDRLAPLIEKVGRDALPLIDSAIQTTLTFFSELIGFFEEAMDPTTDLNNSLSNAGDAIGSLAERIGANIPTMAEQFDILADAVGGFSDALAGLASNIEVVFGPLFDMFAGMEAQVRAGTLTAIAAGLVAIKVGFAGIAAVFTKHPILSGIFLGTMVLGELGKRLEKDAEMTKRFEKTVENLNYDMLENLTVQEEAQFQILAFARANNELEQTLKENPEFTALAEKLGFISVAGDGVVTVLDQIGVSSGITEQLAASDGLPTWLQGIKDRSLNAAEALRELEIAAYAADIASGRIGGSGSSAGEVPVEIDLDDFRRQLGLDGQEEVVGKAATDYVKEFFDGVAEGIEKEAARLDLQELGLSAALIDQILGSQGWEKLFQTIVDGGADMARALQDDFNQTAKGIDELAKAAEEFAAEQQRITEEIASITQQMIDAQDDHKASLKEARAEFDKFTNSLDLTVDGLKTYERQIGQFESQTRNDLQRIESQINSAFDNGYLLMDARDNLLEYARAEFNVLLQIQQQRDDLLSRRNAAADVIFGVASAVTAAGNITSLLRDVQDEVKEVQVSEVFEDVVRSADGLNGFRVTLERNYTDVITDTVNKSQSLVNGFQAVIDRTRAFIDNLKILRELGLDPFLFNQLVEAGAEAGGATAQALVEGGAETVNEVNQLQKELESMGVELGEQAYEVTKNSGEQFVSGIIDGLDAKLAELELTALNLAADFSSTFAMAMSDGMEQAFDIIRQEITAMFNELMAELKAKMAELQSQMERSQGYTDPVTFVTPDETHVSTAVFDPVTGELLRSYTAPIDSDLFRGGMVNPEHFADYPAGNNTQSAAGVQFVQNIYQATNPLDAYNMSKGNVEQQSTFQSSNGDITVFTTGVGN